MRTATISLGLVATVLIAGCAAKPVQKNSGDSATVAAPAVPAAQPAASEQPVATQAALVDTPAGAADDDVVCRNEKLLGTRIGKRVCKSREQLRLEEAAAREMMKNRDRKSHGATDPIMGGG